MNISRTYTRRSTVTAQVGNIFIGSAFPIRIQTMGNTSTNDIQKSVAQAKLMIEAGAELIRFTTQGLQEVKSLAQIRKILQSEGYTTPIVADVHFRHEVADAAADTVEKVRINPGNYAPDYDSLSKYIYNLITICKQHNTALRIGVNHGSLSPRIVEQYGDTPQGMVESCMECLRIAERYAFYNIVLSIKASNTRIMVDTVRLLVQQMEKERMAYPIHAGVTEAGEGDDGRIKSAVGIGALLAEGIGDTIRVSLSESPEAEIPVAKFLVEYFTDKESIRYHDDTIISYDESKQSIFYTNKETDWQKFQIEVAAECGRLLWNYNCKNLDILNPNFNISKLQSLSQDILQASRMRMHKTEFISCPGCGRTMFDLQNTVQNIKASFNALSVEQYPYLQELKIAVMGCIVNGIGEMADADYGYVGAGKNRISLYRKTECIEKNIPQEDAVKALITLIQKDFN